MEPLKWQSAVSIRRNFLLLSFVWDGNSVNPFKANHLTLLLIMPASLDCQFGVGARLKNLSALVTLLNGMNLIKLFPLNMQIYS